MAVPRPVPGDTAATLASITALCAAADAAAAALSELRSAVADEADARRGADDALHAAGAALRAAVADARRAVQDEAATRDRQIADERADRQAALAAAVDTLTRAGDALRDALDAEAAGRARADAAAAAGLDALDARLAAQRFACVPGRGRPGDAPLRFALVASADALGGPRERLPAVPAAARANGDNGAVIRLTTPGILAARAAGPLEIGRLYRARYVVQRRADPADPSGDAVVCGLVYLDQSLRVLGPVTPLRTYPALLTANGRQECEALVARSPGLGAAFRSPPAARFLVPVVAVYGPDAATDVEVLHVRDVTDAFVLAPPVAAFEARLAALEAADLTARLQVLERAAGTPGTLTFGSKGDAAYAAIPDGVQVVTLLGRAYPGDGGGGRYVRTAAPMAPGADGFASHGAVFLRETVPADIVAGWLESGFEAWMAGLPTTPPPGSGRCWNDHGVPAVTP